MKPKYTAYVIKREFLTLSADGNELQQQPTSEEKLMDAIFGQKFICVEIYSKVGIISGKTQKELAEKAWEVNDEKQLCGDFEIFVI